MKVTKFDRLFLQHAKSINTSPATRYRSLLFGLVAMIAASVLPVRAYAQIQPLITTPTVTVFLADPQLGVVGVCQGNGNLLYFEARTPDGTTQLSVRLLDAHGKTIAISGSSMDSDWLNSTYDATSAAQSMSLASALSSLIGTALPGGTVFSREATALSSLATGASQAAPATAAVRIDSATVSLATPSIDAPAIADQFDAAAATNLALWRDALGNLNGTFPGGASYQSFVVNLPNEENEETGGTGVVEVSAQFTISDGTSIAQLLGGEFIPDPWYPKMFQDAPTSTLGPIQTYSQAGNAIRGAMLLARSSTIATSDEATAFNTLATNLRDNGLLPIPSPDAATAGNLYSRVAIWKKGLPISLIAEHSGTIVRHLQGQPGHLHQHTETIYCNHGACPGNKKKMSFKCMWTSGGLSFWRNVPHAVVPDGQVGAGQLHSCYKTRYGLLSGFGLMSAAHNCHDDSWTQVRAIKGESFNLSNGPRCDDSSLYKSAPNCSD
jgi:hypothetical protein